jgi:hypothetical protein
MLRHLLAARATGWLLLSGGLWLAFATYHLGQMGRLVTSAR